MRLRNKSKTIKKFWHILKGHMQLFNFLILFFNSVRKTFKMAKTGPKWLKSAPKRSEFPMFVGRRPTTDLKKHLSLDFTLDPPFPLRTESKFVFFLILNSSLIMIFYKSLNIRYGKQKSLVSRYWSFTKRPSNPF